MNKSIRMILLFGASLFILTACATAKNQNNQADADALTSQIDNAQNQLLNNDTTRTDIEEESQEEAETENVQEIARECFLSFSKTDALYGYEVDELFCDWLEKRYGEQLLADWQQSQANGEKEQQTDDFWYGKTGNTFHTLQVLYLQEQKPVAEELEHIYFKECASNEQIVMDFTGDINFSEGWYTTLHMDAQENGLYDCFSYELRQEMQHADILVVNNEFVYSTRGEAIEGKAYCYRADPSRVHNLTTLGVDLAGLANNHACDFGPEALLDTFDTLRAENIPYVGAGADLNEAMQPVYFVANGRKIAIVAASQIERSYNYTKQATETTPGVLKTLDPTLFVSVIEQAKAVSDYVIVFVHWGTEKQAYYQYDQTDLADAFIRAGADVIVGGHTHCLQGLEYRNGVPIYFSLGNFWQSKKSLDTGIAQVIIDEKGELACRFLPCIQANLETELVTEQEEKERIWEYVTSISTKVAIDENGYISNRKEE